MNTRPTQYTARGVQTRAHVPTLECKPRVPVLQGPAPFGWLGMTYGHHGVKVYAKPEAREQWEA